MLRAGLSELTAFVAIAHQRSFSAAARTLGVSPSALSHAMRGLEARLDVRLFNRTTRSVALTEAGEQLLRRVGPAIADLEDAVNEAASARNRPSGSIRISASESAARPLVQQVLPGFLATYPDIHVEFVVDTRLVDIVADGFDAGIRVLQDVPRDMIATRFGPDMRFIAVASPDYIARHGEPQAPHDLAQHRCIRFRFDSGALYRWDLEYRGKSASLDVDGPMTLGNLNLMVEAALAGIGIAWVTDQLAADHLASGRLVQLLAEWSPSFPGLCLYYPANRHPPTALRLFAQAVREWASGEACR
ncbi:LysR family transcriptional regulator [Paraburkholderia aromaticivorans]|uniref:LysR family transcriptional regulator n=1 Tax=Paraburkholderia aromaticivorans TaxID=2026199 RepID=A0A248VR18_9BURK|nr:LysR family transcriptional regulator [Paraburkholderia aromaticivorans]ASW01484.1 LysR family transcriptional regulator [Paraburkholderia aromaticivorans]